MNGREALIGVFDSGFGRLIMMRSLVDQLPNEDFVYLGDTARTPYNPRPIAQVRKFVIQSLDHLAGRRVRALVIACNSTNSAVLKGAQERYDVSILEAILPAVQRALATSGNDRVGVVCTETIAMSRSYDDAFAVVGNVQLTTRACPRFVGFVEADITGGEELLGVAREYLIPLQVVNIDTLILGCTHYPLLTGVINCVLGDDVVLVSSSDAYAQDTYARLTRKDLLHDTPRHASRQFLTTGDVDPFQSIGEGLLGRLVHDVEQVELR